MAQPRGVASHAWRGLGRVAVSDTALQTEIAEASRRFEGADPAHVLAWAAERFPGRASLATGFGAEGCILIHLVGQLRLPIEVFTLDTGVLFPESYALRDRLEERYGLRIRAVKPSLTLDEQAAQHGPELWAHDPNRCCAIRKIEPLKNYLATRGIWATAIRRDQTADRAGAAVVEWDRKFGLVKVNPLASWTSRDVWRFIRREHVPYNPLHDQGYKSIGCAPCTTLVGAGEDPRAGRWRGQEKTECGLHTLPVIAVNGVPTEAAPR